MSETGQDIRALADDFVLGLLDPSEHERVAAQMERDAGLRAAIAESRDRFLELDMTAGTSVLPADLWDRITARLDQSTAAATADTFPTAPPAARPSPAAANDNRSSVWRPLAMLGMVASLLLAVALIWMLMTQPAPQVVAVLLNDSGEPVVLIEDFGEETARFVPLVDVDVPDDRTMQVWTKWSEDVGPVSLGIVDAAQTLELSAEGVPAPREDQLYEITFEPAGGSPTGLPTGEVYAIGYGRVPR